MGTRVAPSFPVPYDRLSALSVASNHQDRAGTNASQPSRRSYVNSAGPDFSAGCFKSGVCAASAGEMRLNVRSSSSSRYTASTLRPDAVVTLISSGRCGLMPGMQRRKQRRAAIAQPADDPTLARPGMHAHPARASTRVSFSRPLANRRWERAKFRRRHSAPAARWTCPRTGWSSRLRSGSRTAAASPRTRGGFQPSRRCRGPRPEHQWGKRHRQMSQA